MIKWIKQLFCKHEWGKPLRFFVLNESWPGDTFGGEICKKCGKKRAIEDKE
jgi:hypothetical protein